MFGGFSIFLRGGESGIEDLDLSADFAHEILMQINRRLIVDPSAVVAILLIKLSLQAPPR